MSEQPQINVNVNQSGSSSNGGFLGISGILGSVSKILIPVSIIVALILLYLIVRTLLPIVETLLGIVIGVGSFFGGNTGPLGLAFGVLTPVLSIFLGPSAGRKLTEIL